MPLLLHFNFVAIKYVHTKCVHVCVVGVCVGSVWAPNVEAAHRAGALSSLTSRLVEIHAENGCHKCLSNFERQNVREWSQVLRHPVSAVCTKSHFAVRLWAHEKENGAVYAIRIIILEIRIRKLSVESAFHVEKKKLCSLADTIRGKNSRSNYVPPAIINFPFQRYSTDYRCIALVVVLRFSFFLSQPILFFVCIFKFVFYHFGGAHCHAALKVHYAMHKCMHERRTNVLTKITFIYNDDILGQSSSCCVPCSLLIFSILDIFLSFCWKDATRRVKSRQGGARWKEKLKGTHCNLFFIKKPLTDSSACVRHRKRNIAKTVERPSWKEVHVLPFAHSSSPSFLNFDSRRNCLRKYEYFKCSFLKQKCEGSVLTLFATVDVVHCCKYQYWKCTLDDSERCRYVCIFLRTEYVEQTKAEWTQKSFRTFCMPFVQTVLWLYCTFSVNGNWCKNMLAMLVVVSYEMAFPFFSAFIHSLTLVRQFHAAITQFRIERT